MVKDLEIKLKQRLEEYLKQKKMLEMSKHHLRQQLLKFLTFLIDNNLELEAVDLEKAQEYKNILDKQSFCADYIVRLFRNCINFYNYLLKKKQVKINPFDILWRKVKDLKPGFEYPYLDDFCKINKWKRRRRKVLIRLFDYLNERKISIEDVSKKTAQAYLKKLQEQKDLSSATKNLYIKIIISFFYYLKDQGLVSKNPFTKKDKIRYEKTEHMLLYERYAKYRGLREETIKNYTTNIRAFFIYIEKQKLDIKEVRPAEAMVYLEYLFTRYSKEIISYKIESLKSYYDFLFRQKLIYSNPFKGLKRMPINKKIPRNLPKEKKMDEILEKTKDFNQGSRFDRIRKYKLHVLFELLYSTGLRISEAGKLKPEDIDFEKGIVNIREGKGGKERIAILCDYTKEILKIYTQTLPLLHNTKRKRNNNLFGICPARLKILANAELKNYGNYTSHVFRHCVGYHLLKAGCDIRYIQEALGHDRLVSTELYTKVDKEDLRDIIDKYHPRQWRENR